MEKSNPDWEREAQFWFLRRVLRHLVQKFGDTILMNRYIMKQPLYKTMSWWFRLKKEETREVLTMLSRAFPGIVFSNRGLHVSTTYLDPKNGVVDCSRKEKPLEAVGEGAASNGASA